MAHKLIIRFFLAAILSLPQTVEANYFRLDYSPVLYHWRGESRLNGTLIERLDFRTSHYFGMTYSLNLSRASTLSLGLGLSRVHFEKQVQGVFPQTNAYGLAAVVQRNDYWVFPVTFYHSLSRRNNSNSGIRIAYLPQVLGGRKYSIATTAGAENSGFAENYADDSQEFRHSLQLYVTNLVSTQSRSFFVGIDPFIGFGSSFFKTDGIRINTISYGLSLNVQFRPPRISIDISRKTDPQKAQKQKEIERKQKEIEQQLKNKPKKPQS